MLRELGLMDLILLIPSTKLEENIELLLYSLKKIEELERLAKIGRATEKWFIEGHIMEYTGNEVYGIDDLLDWAKED